MRTGHKRRGTLTLVLLSLGGVTMVSADDWPQWRGPGRDGVWRESGIVEKFAGPELTLKWRVPVGAGYSGPTVARGRVYLTDRVTEPRQQERVLCFDEQTGKTLWSYAYDCTYTISYTAGPRACVTVADGQAFALGAMGHLYAFAAETGEVLWRHDCLAEYQIALPIWGIAAAPLVFEDLVVVHIGGKEACLVAFRRQDGKEVWRALSDRAQYSAPILVEQAGQRVLVCWTGDSIAGLDPRTGRVFWRHELKPNKMPIG
ncbi:MAG: PQQ-binding-like beta-propeller repeat protein, partial [Pirellulaceae bacterium]